MDAVATRFTLPVRSAAYSPSGLNLAAGGDDEGIKLIDVSTCKVFRHLKSQVRCGGCGACCCGCAAAVLLWCCCCSCKSLCSAAPITVLG